MPSLLHRLKDLLPRRKKKVITETVVVWDLQIRFVKAGDETVDITKPSLVDYVENMLTNLIAQICGVPKEDVITHNISKEVVTIFKEPEEENK